MNRKDIEIMAPVGSWESLTAAVQAGTDSVYFGIDRLNMRSQSTINFKVEDLSKIVGFCRSHQVKTYLTLNTVIYNHDLPLMQEIVDGARLNGVHAIIASDLAVIQYARSQGVEVHISTQQNISNIEAVRFFANFADVLVMARELTLDQVATISAMIRDENICGPSGRNVELELFVHGALCMAISGKCYLSLHHYNKSANRGSCLQLCRRSYTVTDNETKTELEIDNEYIMSPKDLCTIEFLDKILQAGVKVLKIEGRARPAEYVKTVVDTYDQAVRAIVSGTFTHDKALQWKLKLAEVFNRGFWDGYYLGQTLGEWSASYGSKATKKKIYIGKGINYFSNLQVAEFLVESGSVRVGDEILITGPTTGVVETTVSEIRVDLKTVEKADKGEHFSMPVKQQIRRSDKLFRIVTTEG